MWGVGAYIEERCLRSVGMTTDLQTRFRELIYD
jgi:hypothetical protein